MDLFKIIREDMREQQYMLKIYRGALKKCQKEDSVTASWKVWSDILP